MCGCGWWVVVVVVVEFLEGYVFIYINVGGARSGTTTTPNHSSALAVSRPA